MTNTLKRMSKNAIAILNFLGTLYASGHITNNDGSIDECNGAVGVNNGTGSTPTNAP